MTDLHASGRAAGVLSTSRSVPRWVFRRGGGQTDGGGGNQLTRGIRRPFDAGGRSRLPGITAGYDGGKGMKSVRENNGEDEVED